MTFRDWLTETRERYRTLPLTAATKESLHGLRMGAQRRIGPHIGESIWARDWDVLIVLDACRVDQMNAVLAEYPDLPDECQTHISRASCSIDWINRTFNDYPEESSRAGYVTANPFADHSTPSAQSADLADGPVQYFQALYRTHWQDIDGQTADGTTDERAKVGSGIATVPPEAVTDYTIDGWRRRDELGIDRLVAHYMQPHEPYRSHPDWGSGDSNLLENLVDEDAQAGESVWPAAKRGAVSTDELWQAGVDNLRWVLDDITERLLPNIDGTVVLTADHGNAMGEWGEWHHPPGALSPAVREVPWIELSATDSRTVKPRVRGDETTDQPAVSEQLDALGYR